MRRAAAIVITIATVHAATAVAHAQRLTFERALDVTGAAALDVITERGKIDIVAGEPGKVVVTGTVTIRMAWDVPTDAVEIARQIVDHPPIEQAGNTVRLRPPAQSIERRAVTLSYEVRVPPDSQVTTQTDSGATTIRDLTGRLGVRTQSAAIELHHVAESDVHTGSGSVLVDGGKGSLTVQTSSSAVTVRALTGPLKAVTQSGSIKVEGTVQDQWSVTTGSSSVDLTVAAPPALTLDAESRSGQITVAGASVAGSVSKRKVAGTIGGGGPQIRVTTGSGAIRIRVGSAG